MKPSCYTEYDPLKKVIVCHPKYMGFGKIRNVENQSTKKVSIHIDKAMSQHGEFVRKLRDYGVEVEYLTPKEGLTEGVYTRDIAFTLGEDIFIAKMAHPPRVGEENNLIQWLNLQGIQHQDLFDDHIEGGDVLIDQDTIYIGVSNRTTEAAIKHVRSLLPNFNIIDLPFSDKFLHLDCIFNILSPTEALIYPGEFPKEKEDYLRSRYNLIEVSTKEQESLGTNVLSIGHRRVFSHSENSGVNESLRHHGYEVIEVDFSEIIKSGGAFRCCSFPLVRASTN